MLRLWSFQTEHERLGHSTGENNGVGLNKFDALRAGALLEKVQRSGWTDADLRLARRIVGKYAGQLAQQANISQESG